ncbi:selenocysteine lyase/cysteine desulfurase [Humitalea rosea]|uniref:Selenocysteine lyase/cysteine desulfurase n=1 Tax=Humitalea rosea TaxID=990373 RepID=A0A2W7KGT8_9PROT|nr:aminotransferase class V-fold PLP-dependent enzyme [Humitalea rosea]PZW47033.1 selenocysteine lyase/cysteine desulfurase [Humitalea rosea]
MLPSQRALFDIPREVSYLDAASASPLPLAVRDAGLIGARRKVQPWTLDPARPAVLFARARAAAALIGAEAVDIALIPSISYGIATAAKILPVPRGSRVLVLHEDHASPVLEWESRAEARGFTVEAVMPDPAGDWTAMVLAAIARPGAAPVALASISTVHWADGGMLDMAAIAVALRAAGALLVVDATQAAGAVAIDVRGLDPDVLVFPTYKWVLGPYGRAFLYIARRHQGGVPLEQTAHGRRAVTAERAPYFADTAYIDGARRFDMGERDHYIGMEMAAIGMEMMAGWGTSAITQRLGALTSRLQAGLADSGARMLPARLRAPHILSLGFPHGLPSGLMERLEADGVHVAARLGRLRISPHVYNDEADVDRFLQSFLTATTRRD